MTSPPDAATLDAVRAAVATERARIVAGLIRLTGDWDLAEDCVQDAAERALRCWPRDGLPRAPGAWLTTVASNRARDLLRRRTTERAKLQQRALLDEVEAAGRQHDDPADARLGLVFACCHPALPLDGRVALTLKTVGGLSTAQIAGAFLVSEATLSQRLLRTKRKISHAGIPFRVPPDDLLDERTGGVLAVVYLIFTAGYSQLDDALATEALRLARLLVELLPDADEALGLLALIALQLSRRATRFDAQGDLVPMEEQDRDRWDGGLVREGQRSLRRAAASRRPPGSYRLQAEIAACHATAVTADRTPWSRIVVLYDALLATSPSAVIALNRAIAVGFCDGYEAGLAELAAIDDARLRGYYLLPAARGDFLRRLGRTEEALRRYREASELVPADEPAGRLLRRRIAELAAEPRRPATSATITA